MTLRWTETYEGYWTGDYECACFADARLPKDQTNESRQYILLSKLDEHKRYKVTLMIEAEELPTEEAE